MVDLVLYLFLCDDEPGQAIVSPLLHPLHSIVETSTLTRWLESLNQVYFCVGSDAQHPDPLEVFSLHGEGFAYGHLV